MRGWEHHCPCTRFLAHSKRFFQRISYRWMIIGIAVGLFLCWDASLSQGCSREESCTRLFLHQVFLGNGQRAQHKARVKHGQEALVQRVSKTKAIYRDQSNFIRIVQNSLVDAAVTFNNSVLLVLNPPIPGLRDAVQQGHHQLRCVYATGVYTNVLSVEDEFVECTHPHKTLRKPLASAVVSLEFDEFPLQPSATYGKVLWKRLVYGWVPLSGEGEALLFVKGLSHSKRSLLPNGLECQYGDNVRTQVVAFCQENVRCKLPPVRSQHEHIGKPVTLVYKGEIFSSVVRFSTLSLTSNFARHQALEAQTQYFLCACTLVWNGANFLKEWVTYHSHIGVQRFFFYDNNSDDDIERVLESLQYYNVSRHAWPWLKTQEASFAHCAIRAARECAWVAFNDLDEFIFPKSSFLSKKRRGVEPALHALIKLYEEVNKGKLGQLRISNFNFGPSGLSRLPKSGQMVNYVCRMRVPRRVKSIVRATAIHPSYCSRVHYFELKGGFMSAQAMRKDAVIHHYKYQVWEDFKLKFVRRAATFVTDWGQSKDLDSFDRTPGLGTEAIEPSDWAHQFCEIQDTALKEYVLNASQLHFEGKLLWE